MRIQRQDPDRPEDGCSRLSAETWSAEEVRAEQLSALAQANEDLLILDPSIFGCLRELLDEKTLAYTYRDFLEHLRLQLRNLPAVSEGRSLRDLGHTIRGTAGMLGANELAAFAAELEAELPSHQALAQVVTRMSHGCIALEKALRDAQVNV